MEQRGNDEHYEAQMPEWRSVQLNRGVAPISVPFQSGAPFKMGGVKANPVVDFRNSTKTSFSDSRDLNFKVPALPKGYPLEKTAGIIKDLSTKTIISRISENLRLNSFTASLHPNEGFVECTSPTMCEFRIQLWTKKTKKASVIVEVQPCQSGSGMESHALCKSLFPSIRTGNQTVQEPQVHRTCLSREVSGGDEEEALMIILSLLESSHVDQNRLGLESLSSMTDSNVVGLERTKSVSRAVVFAEGREGERLQRALAPYFEAQCDSALHYLALMLLSKALQVMSSNVVELDTKVEFWKLVTASLCRNIRMAEHEPHFACCSTRCIRILSGCDGIRASSMGDILEAIERAELFGKTCHASLERESRSLLVSQFVQ